jgi:chromosome segregation ATPase
MKKKAELVEDVEKAEKLAQHWKTKADQYLDKITGLNKDTVELNEKIKKQQEKIVDLEMQNDQLRKMLYEKKFVAEDIVELLDDLSLNDFTFFLSHFLNNLRFSLQLKEEENDTRNVILKLDDRHDQPIAYGGDVYLHFVPDDHPTCRVKFSRFVWLDEMEKQDEVE